MRDDSARTRHEPASITRRDVLRLAGGAIAGGTLVGGSAAEAGAAATPPGPKKKVVVAGGGIGGLSCAWELAKRGHDVTVLEAAGQPGGHVRTIRDPLADGLYVDGGAEHFTKPGYEIFRGYVEELGLTALPYPRRHDILRMVGGRLRTEEMLADRTVLSGLGFNEREVEFLAREPWWKARALYHAPYLDAFADEYRPFEAGLDALDEMTFGQLLERDGASPAFREHFGGGGSALQEVWHAAILKLRGVPLFPLEVFRIKGGNQTLPNTIAARLGDRVRLGCPVTAIERGDGGVRVSYTESGHDQVVEADWLVSAMSLVALRGIPVTPPWPAAREFVVQGFPYYTASRPVFQSRTRFWERDGVSSTIEIGDRSLDHVWSTADDVPTTRGLLVGTAIGNSSAEDALAAFRRVYPGRSEDVEQAFVIDWSRDPWAMACEPVSYHPGELARYWPRVIEPEGRVQFVGAYADNLGWGMEAATRSARRVALAIDAA